MITSLSNERVKRVRTLQEKRRARHKSKRFVAEGKTLLRDALDAGAEIEEVFYTEAFTDHPENASLLEALSGTGANLLPVDASVMQEMSDTSTSQGILAVLPQPQLEPPEDFSFALVIDAVSNPGNMGTIMRAAAAADIPLMFVTKGTVDLTNPKVVRSAMGAHFRLPVKYMSWEGIVSRLDQHVIFLAESKGGASCYQVDWKQPSALIISDEAHGASDEAIRFAHARVSIPMPGQMESLNVAMASSILLFEMVRQRMESDQ